jgi:hypothetical protein
MPPNHTLDLPRYANIMCAVFTLRTFPDVKGVL